ncbi:hypothetical protein STEG23_010634, partial [Scotinomys teguina]
MTNSEVAEMSLVKDSESLLSKQVSADRCPIIDPRTHSDEGPSVLKSILLKYTPQTPTSRQSNYTTADGPGTCVQIENMLKSSSLLRLNSECLRVGVP